MFTGLSGSGKSSLAFDTIYAEGQRRYVESLSAYARQFLGQMDKPDVDFIEGLSPAISIDQKSASRNPRSTVGTITEVYDYLRLLYARIGGPHCPNCGRPVARQTPQQIVDRVLELPDGTRFQVLAPVVRGRKGEYSALLEDLARQGFARARVDGVPLELADRAEVTLARYEQHTIEVVVDRLVRRDGIRQRLTESIETALRLTGGTAEVLVTGGRRRGGGHHLQPAPGLHPLRAQLRGARAPQLLVQLALRGLPHLCRPRHPIRGRPRAGGPRPQPLAGRRRPRPVGRRPERVLHRPGQRGRRPGRILGRHPVGQAAGQGQEAGPLRAPAPSRSTSSTGTASAAAAPTSRTTRGSCPGSSAATARPSPTARASRSSSTCARCDCPACGGARLRPESPGGHGRRDEHPRAVPASPSTGRWRRWPSSTCPSGTT